MEIEQIYSALSAKVGQTSLSKKTITDFITAMAPKEGDPDDAWYESTSTVLKSLGGNFSHDMAEKVNEFKKNYKPETQAQQTVQPTQQPQVNQQDDTMAAITKQLEELKAQMLGFQTKGREDAIRNSALSQASELRANQGLWKMAVEQTAIDENATVDSFMAKVKPVYESLQKSVFGDAAVPLGASQDTTEKAAQQEIDDFFASKGGVWAQK